MIFQFLQAPLYVPPFPYFGKKGAHRLLRFNHNIFKFLLKLQGEYTRGSDCTNSFSLPPLPDDKLHSPAIINSQWNANTATGEDHTCLNHSTSDNYSADTAQGKIY